MAFIRQMYQEYTAGSNDIGDFQHDVAHLIR